MPASNHIGAKPGALIRVTYKPTDKVGSVSRCPFDVSVPALLSYNAVKFSRYYLLKFRQQNTVNIAKVRLAPKGSMVRCLAHRHIDHIYNAYRGLAGSTPTTIVKDLNRFCCLVNVCSVTCTL